MIIIGRDIICKMYCTLLTFRSLDVHFMSKLVHGHKLSFFSDLNYFVKIYMVFKSYSCTAFDTKWTSGDLPMSLQYIL